MAIYLFMHDLTGFRHRVGQLLFFCLYLSSGPACAQVLHSWDFTQGLQDWVANENLSEVVQTPEGIGMTSVAEDPYLTGPLMDYPIALLLRVTVRMKSTADENGEIFYGENFVASRSKRFEVIPDGEWHDYEVYIRGLYPRARLRLDPAHLTGEIVLASIKVESVPHPTLDNGSLKIVLDLLSGGAISYLGVSGTNRNLVNIHDRGRYIQQSYYAGQSLDRRSEGQASNWSPWPWNPIQVGDAFGNTATILEAWVRDGTAYTKCQPLLWDMNYELAECTMEMWVRLSGNTVQVRNRLTCFRTDNRWNLTTNDQELPAIYTIGDLHRLVSYDGQAPWTSGAVREFTNSGPPWIYWENPEHWAALIDANDFGVGVYNSVTPRYIGGFHGTPGGNATDNSTGYISPIDRIQLRKDTVLDYEYELIVGTLTEIRAFVYDREGHLLAGQPTPTPTPLSAPETSSILVH